MCSQIIHQVQMCNSLHCELWSSFSSFNHVFQANEFTKISSDMSHALERELHTMQFVRMATDCNFMQINAQHQMR